MDPNRFDALARTVVAATTRRGLIGLLLGSGLAGFDRDALAGNTKRKPKKGNDRAHRRRDKAAKSDEQTRPPVRVEVASCCASGACAPGKGKDLAKCCYQGQDLTGKNFSGSNLRSASFSRAILKGVNLQSANLDTACLADADLRGAKINSATNLSKAVYCRTRTDTGENNSGCGLGTPCCPTCDLAHPCGAGQVCCDGRCTPGSCCDNGEQSSCGDGAICCGNRCVDGDCCRAADCPNQICQRRSCQGNTCVYAPIFGTSGPLCQTVCCENLVGEPACCAVGITGCQASGICGCAGDADCGDQKCCAGTCVPRTTCCEGGNAEGCPADLHCCVVAGNGVCRECCEIGQCPDETCETKTCSADGTCTYVPVFGDDGPGCTTICCENADEQPVCCPDGTTVCTASGRCRCDGAADCAANQLCCNGTCIANTQCCDGNPGTCPAPGVCQIRACASGACQPRGVSGGSCPLPGGGTGVCRDGTCVCPSPRITCDNVCCGEGATQCAPDGTCPRVCDVCPSGCPFTTVAAAIAGTNAGGTIRICPGTYATLNARVAKNLTIIGAGSGADGTILDGQRTNRIFTIADGVTATIRDLAITRGLGTQQDNTGAGILVRFDASLTLERVEVTDNANPSGFGLGAIYVAPRSSLLLQESRVANNLNFSFGGGIMVDDNAAMTLERSRIEGNSAGFGGGIWMDTGGVVNLDDDSIITGNFVFQRRGGGGIFNKGTVNGATVSNVTGNTGGDPPVPSNCDNSQGGTGCPT